MPLVISGFYNGDNITPQSGGMSHALGWALTLCLRCLVWQVFKPPTTLRVRRCTDIGGKPVSGARRDEGFGYELGGNKAWFGGDYKLVLTLRRQPLQP